MFPLGNTDADDENAYQGRLEFIGKVLQRHKVLLRWIEQQRLTMDPRPLTSGPRQGQGFKTQPQELDGPKTLDRLETPYFAQLNHRESPRYKDPPVPA